MENGVNDLDVTIRNMLQWYNYINLHYKQKEWSLRVLQRADQLQNKIHLKGV